MALVFNTAMNRASRTVMVTGERLAALWRESAMSQESFAHSIGMKRSGFLRLMQPGEHGMFTDNFRRMADAVGVTPNQLRGRIGPEGKVDLDLDSIASAPVSRVGPGVSGVSGTAHSLREITRFHGISAGARLERLPLEQGTVKLRCLKAWRDSNSPLGRITSSGSATASAISAGWSKVTTTATSWCCKRSIRIGNGFPTGRFIDAKSSGSPSAWGC